MKLEYNLINGKDGLDESLYLFVGPKISELGTTIEGDSENEYSFYRGYGLLNLPEGITEIGDWAFEGCWGFTDSLIIPNSVTVIGKGAFNQCSGFTGALTIPNSVTSIGGSAFGNCSGLTSLTIGNSVTSIGSHAFESCTGLTSVTIPDSVTEIGNGAFGGCNGLTSITCLRTTPPILNTDVFSNTNDCTIYVPAESVDEYKAASGWSTYASRIQSIPTT